MGKIYIVLALLLSASIYSQVDTLSGRKIQGVIAIKRAAGTFNEGAANPEREQQSIMGGPTGTSAEVGITKECFRYLFRDPQIMRYLLQCRQASGESFRK